jgi:phosphoglucosamine mutase
VAPNGLNINEGVGSTAPAALCRAVLEAHADLGIGLDGDGDRVVMVDAKGRLYDGDLLLYVIARERLATDKLEGVVGTVMTNLGVEQALARLGLDFARASVGDRHVLEMLVDRGWLLGGESSGHIICRDHHTTSDAIIAALQVLAAMRRNDVTLAEACTDVDLYSQSLVNVPLPAGFDWENDTRIQSLVREAISELGDQGRVLVRASGTEPVLRVMAESRDAAAAAHWAEAIAAAIDTSWSRDQ